MRNIFHRISMINGNRLILMIFLSAWAPVCCPAQDNAQYRNFGHDFTEKLHSPAYRIPAGPFKPDWKSLVKHPAAPDWFRDAKFGIYITWGVYSVPAFYNEWYPYFMYDTGSTVYKHHLETYGSPLKFGYPDFIPMFKAEHFDPEAWAELFKNAGARFAGPMAEHHDGFAMWKTEWTPWNSFDMGPQRDIVGELITAVRKQGMRAITTFHHARNELWKNDGKWIGQYAFIKKYFPALLNDPERAIMYGYLPRKIFLEMWRGKLEEVVNKYHPDLMWFDGQFGLTPDSVVTKYLAFYFNKAAREERQVAVTAKHKQMPLEMAIQDFERGRADRLEEIPWLTDDAIGDNSWGYIKGLQLKTSAYIIHELIDIVSKNGNLLLNVSPKSDGTIPKKQKEVLLGIGKWLRQNGESIYGTRPWRVFGEGPTRLDKGGSFTKKVNYTPQDVRYTRREDTVYAIEMGWPGANEKITLESWHRDLHWGTNIEIIDVSVLGSNEKIHWEWPSRGLIITTPSHAPNKVAIVFRIITKHY